MCVEGESGDPAGLDDGTVLYASTDGVVHGAWLCIRVAGDVLQGCEQVAEVVAGCGAWLQEMSHLRPVGAMTGANCLREVLVVDDPFPVIPRSIWCPQSAPFVAHAPALFTASESRGSYLGRRASAGRSCVGTGRCSSTAAVSAPSPTSPSPSPSPGRRCTARWTAHRT